jgi:hypothetical protein
MNGFTKLVPEIVQSSIWNESPEVRCVWITLLAIKDEHGNVRGNRLTLARIANVPVESVDMALERFQSPDPYSNTPDHEGRRIEAMPGGWHVLNHALYRARDYREHEALRKRTARRKEKGTQDGEGVRTCPDMSGNVTDGSASASASSSVLNDGGCGGKNPRGRRRVQFKPGDDVAAWIPCTRPVIGAEAMVCVEDERDGWLVPISTHKVKEWEASFPDVDVLGTLAEIRQRIRDTGKYRKTPGGVCAMVGTWLTREQNQGGRR